MYRGNGKNEQCSACHAIPCDQQDNSSLTSYWIATTSNSSWPCYPDKTHVWYHWQYPESCQRRFAHWGVDLLCKVLWARCTCRECCSTHGMDGFLRACRLRIIIAIITNKASLYNMLLSFNRYLASFVPAYQKWAPKGEQASLAGRPPTPHRLLSPWALPRDDLRRRQCRHTSGPQHSTVQVHYTHMWVMELIICHGGQRLRVKEQRALSMVSMRIMPGPGF